ncbi:hypothetical protein CYMTET_11539 [Cymbomonas tetramitiformis]|uniref:NADP-dependent malic enzyme n=1 Tax=Cymbomonas tetramitiformis TaxID=36881 RepID=A0AAE0GM31_9CHLO|nr:hypothetical protein CYMTET_11539 [Cymbomonas tetramitiformis]
MPNEAETEAEPDPEADEGIEDDNNRLRAMALQYHRRGSVCTLGEGLGAGKLSVTPTRRLANQLDLSLAYSPGVGACCEEIVSDPQKVSEYTARGNTVAVMSNGTAVLGYGNIGPLAAKPVMEGKAVLFKKFAGIDAFDLEIAELDPLRFADIVVALEPSFGAVNLEDIKAPDCFVVEEECRKRMNIPVFHDDQHGTAIVVAAAITNALQIVGKDIKDVRMVCNGAGAAAIACLNLLMDLGLKRSNILVADRTGIIHAGRSGLNKYKAPFAVETDCRTLEDAFIGADICLGLSSANAFSQEMVQSMAKQPIVMALSNPVNNVLCFPFLFRGALDCGASDITSEMKMACVKAIAELARRASTSDMIAKAYEGNASSPSQASTDFGPNYLIPKPFDPRLLTAIAPAIAKAAMECGVAKSPITDMDAYCEQLTTFVYRTNTFMGRLFQRAKQNVKHVVFAEGEDERVLQAVRLALDDNLCKPILIGRISVISRKVEALGLDIPLCLGRDAAIPEGTVEVVDMQDDSRYARYWQEYHHLCQRKGINPATAREGKRTELRIPTGGTPKYCRV